MKLFDRLYHSLIGFIFGAFLGVVCWFLYGLAFPIKYLGPEIDPMLRHDFLLYTYMDRNDDSNKHQGRPTSSLYLPCIVLSFL